MISIVVPVFNEEESIGPFFAELARSLSLMKEVHEIIFIDDGSYDNTLEDLKKLSKKDALVRIFSFRKNAGKAEALTFGFAKAKGEYVVTLDADLQDKPSEIIHLLKKAREGWDVVSGWRKERKDSRIKILSSKLFNRIASLFFGVSLHDYNCGLKVYSSDAAKSLHLYGGLHRFIPLIAHQQGFTITEVSVKHEYRKFGKSKFGSSKIWKELPDMFTMLFLIKYSKRPLHFFAPLGFLFSLIGTLIVTYFWIIHTFYKQTVGGRPLLFIGMILIITGLEVFFTGFLADLMISISQGSLSIEESMKTYLRYDSDKK